MNSPNVKRTYDASRRQAQARQLRREVVDAARELFIERGFAATTVAEIADAAGVSQPFVYSAFGSKRGLLGKVVDWTLVGDDEPIPMRERPSIRAIQQEPTITGKCALHARHVRLVSSRISSLLQMLRAAADADPDARAIYENGEEQRLTAARLLVTNLRTAGDLRAGLTDAQAADAIWALTPHALWTALVVQRGWSADDFELWYAGLVASAVLEDRQVAVVRQFTRRLLADPTPPS